MHPANKKNKDHLSSFFKKLQLEGIIENVTELEEDDTGYSIKVQPSFPIRPVWHIRIYIEEKA